MNKYSGDKFLNKLYSNLHMSAEFMHSALKSDDKNEKVKKYLDRLENVEKVFLNKQKI